MRVPSASGETRLLSKASTSLDKKRLKAERQAERFENGGGRARVSTAPLPSRLRTSAGSTLSDDRTVGATVERHRTVE